MDGWTKHSERNRQPSYLTKKKKANFFTPGGETDSVSGEEGLQDSAKEKKEARGNVIDDFFLSDDYPWEDSEEY